MADMHPNRYETGPSLTVRQKLLKEISSLSEELKKSQLQEISTTAQLQSVLEELDAERAKVKLLVEAVQKQSLSVYEYNKGNADPQVPQEIVENLLFDNMVVASESLFLLADRFSEDIRQGKRNKEK